MKVNGFWKKTLCLVLAMAMVLGNASPVVAAHEHETAAEIVTEITNATIKEAEKLIDKTGLMNAADVTDTKNTLEEADSNLAGSMDDLGTAVEDAQAKIDELEGKVTKDDAAEINASLSVAYDEANRAWEEAVAASDAAVADLEKAAEAYEAANKISDEAAKVAEAELKAAQEALNAAVEATKFANDNMTSLKNEFAKATELATKWSTEVETALAEATAKFEEAQAALNSALEALESGDAELKAAIDTFKACYDAFIEAANAFKASIETAVAAQEALDALYAEYEEAQAAYAEALAAYEAKCAEYEAAGYPNTYEGYAEALKTLNEALEKLETELEKAEGIEVGAKATWEAALLGEDYLAMKELTDVFATVPVTDEEKAAVEKAAYEAAVYVIEKKLANGKTVINVDKEGNNADGIPTYGKASEDYFVVLNEKGEAVSRYDYKLSYDENGKGVVSIFEMEPTNDVTNYVDYNGKEVELKVEGNQYYIVVDSNRIDLVKDEENKYIETLTAKQTFAENPADRPLEVNAAGLIQYVIKNIFNIDLPLKDDENGYYVEVDLGVTKLRIPIEVNVKLQHNEKNEYFVTLLEGVEILGQSLEITLPVEVSKRADNSGYDVNFVYYVDMLYSEEDLNKEGATVTCTNEAHDSKYGHVNEVTCDVPLHVRYGKHDASFVEECVSHMTDAECKAEPCDKESHKTYGHDANTIIGTCDVHKPITISYGLLGSKTYPAHDVKNGVLKGLVSASKLGSDYEEVGANCGMSLNGICTSSTCIAGTVEVDCPGPFGFCNKEPRYIDVHGTVFEKTLPQAVYEGKEYKVQGNSTVGLYIEIPSPVEGEAATRIDVTFVKTGEDTEKEIELGYYTYEVKHDFVQGGTEDTVFAISETALGVDSNVYAKEVATLENKYLACVDECDRIEGLIADKEEEITTFKATYADLVSAYNTKVAAETLATEKELGALAELPKNISELVEGMEVEEMLTLLETIIELSSQSDDVDYEKVLEVLSDVIDANAATRLIAVLAYDAIGDILPFGIFDDILGGIIGGIGEQITPPTAFEKTYANAWVDALTTKIKVVQNAIDLVNVAVETVEAGVTAVTEGIELAEVAVDAVLATAEKKMLEATVEVLVMANDVLNSSEEIVLSIDSIISAAQARTEKAYLVAVAESNALNQVVITRPYASKLDETLVTIGAANALNADLTADIALAEVSIASAKALYEELKVLEEHEHVYLSKITEATCDEDGSIVHVCTICTHTYTDVLEATGHAYEAVVTAPTCTEAGYTTYTCTVCNDSYKADEVEALGHDYESVETVPTCTEDGYTTHTCKVCGDTYVDAEVEATGHTHKTEEKEATCEEDGYVTYTCACGDTYTVVLPAFGHKYETTTVNATCETAGSVTTKCATCGDTTVEVIEALGHKYELTDSKPATCTADGMNVYTCANCRDQKSEVVAALGHKYDTVVTAPTCTVDGYTTHTCSVCKDTYTDSKVAAIGHNYELTDSKPATCLADGSNIYTCSGCKDVKREVLAATGHAYEAEVTAPTCTAGGYTTHTCNNCGDKYNTDEVAASGHNYEAEVTAPTCTVDGYTTHICSRCKESYKDTVVTAPGHDWSGWEVTRPATDKEFGEEIRHCKVEGCEVSQTREIDPTGHEHTLYVFEVKEPTCTEGGYTIYACGRCNYKNTTDLKDALKHSFGEWKLEEAPTCTAPGKEVRICVRCNNASEEQTIQATGHAWGEWEVISEVKDHQDGLKVRRCSVCNTPDEQVIAAPEHDYQVVDTTDPTCTEAGYTTYTCTICGGSYEADYVDATGHTYDAVVTAPTCTETGYTTYTCACGDSYTADTTSALGHDYVPTVTAPKCEAEGYTTYKCSRCDDSYVADATPATGHNYGEWTVEVAPTCTKEGTEAHICAACGDKETRAIEATGHSFGEWTVAEAATCTEEGTEVRACAVCEAEETRVIEALGHNYEAVVTAPTCTANGYTTHTCTACNDTYTDTVVSATGHSYTVRVVDPTCTEEGYTTFVCHCGVYETGNETEALGHTWSAWTVTTEATETATGLETRECAVCHATEINTLPMLEAAPVADDVEGEVENEVDIEDEETPLAGGEDEVVIEDEETPLAGGEEITIEEEEVPLAAGNGANVGIAVAAVGGIAVVGTGAAVAASQAGLFGTGAAATSAATSAASAGTAGAGSKGFLAVIAAFFKKLFRK